MMMEEKNTTLELPQLARFLGKKVQYEWNLNPRLRPDNWQAKQGEVTVSLLKGMSEGTVRNIKPCLRPLESLTDVELYRAFEKAMGYMPASNKLHGINREDGKIEVYSYPAAEKWSREDLSLFMDGTIAVTGYHSNGIMYSPMFNAVALYDYLDELGID
ncbi:hypothetical protein IC229_33255 [Spirosoma sp. BT702]|uniref:Uncharacterized protein n=1 Tax=Spirosoma profusum TaxID=2771354 RepID=A0A927AW74_9BACT|nr:hypothetical protein [Spirosoma profusum]MBD2705524.1 hypothetical protein [Spirosoma profusum]